MGKTEYAVIPEIFFFLLFWFRNQTQCSYHYGFVMFIVPDFFPQSLCKKSCTLKRIQPVDHNFCLQCFVFLMFELVFHVQINIRLY